MSIRKYIKYLSTYIVHPYIGISLRLKGTRRIYIGPRMVVNKIRYLFIKSNVSIGKDSRFLFVTNYYGKDYNPKLIIGNNVCIGDRFSALSANTITIEDNCLIASDVLITSENHGMNPELSDSYANIPLDSDEVVIGKGCWIGEKVSILPGVRIGERSIIATNAVVTKSIPPYSIAAGIPARIIKQYNFELHSWESMYKNDK